MVSTSVFAEWTEVAGNAHGMMVYADFGTIKKKGNKVKMWTMYDFKTVQKVGNDSFLSSVSRNEYDCEEETVRLLDFYWYSGNMRQGEIVVSSTNIKRESKSIMPDTFNDDLLKIACGKK